MVVLIIKLRENSGEKGLWTQGKILLTQGELRENSGKFSLITLWQPCMVKVIPMQKSPFLH